MTVEPTGRPGAENMAIDQALLDDVAARRDGAAYLRLYRWDPPCLSLGRNEPALVRYDRATIAGLGLDVVRRPTGGRAVWHEHEVTYAVAAPVAAFGSLRESYWGIHQRLARALRCLGAPATLAPEGGSPRLAAGACFAQPVGGEVLLGGRKVVGSAQVREGAAFLQHGSILVDGTQEIVAHVSHRSEPAPCATTLSEALGREVTFQEVTESIRATWLDGREDWVQPFPAVLPSCRSAAFTNPSWTWRR